MKNIYFDNAATTKLDDEVLKEMLPYLKDNYGNPSSIYKLGREARKAIEDSREKIAKVLNCKANEIYFTAGGSESDNTAIKGIAKANKKRGNHIITSKIEHPAVLETCKQLEKEGFEITYISVDEKGIVDLEELKKSIKPTTILITIMFANNEIGTIQPIEEIGKIAKGNNIYFHTDSVQAVGSIKIDVQKLNIDSLSLSGHKFYGPKGVGALYVKTGVPFEKFISGGHQERNKRAGTENVAGIVGIGKAIELAYENLDEYNKKIKELRDYYVKQVEEKIPYIKINGDMEKRLPGNSNISFRFIEGEGLLLNLDLKGICASSGSACTSGSLDPSHVLLAIGLPHEIAHGSLRVSIGKYNTKEEIDYLIENLMEIVTRLREMSPLWEKFMTV
ncbi:MAG TPA: cysteine desulfurase NifS [Clostridiales bacterium]|jgi:cysteine desulfurase|nr:cysteine desulfurase NifS [Clostridiales bacterium]